jgi:hypothetical protein
VKAAVGIGMAAATGVLAAGVTVVLGAVAVATYLGGGDTPVVTAAACTTATTSTTTQLAAMTTAKIPAGYNQPDQVANARTIITVGQQMGIPARGWIIGVATAMQEAVLHNPGNLGARNDHDSLGLFQQRPSTGWGTPAQIMDPAHATRSFFTALQRVDGWQSMTLTRAAQAVQRSAFPGAYAKHETAATATVDAITGDHTVNVISTVGSCAQPGQVTAGGWVVPVVVDHTGSPFGSRGGKLHAGVDLIVPKHTAIHAAADGTVIEAHCDASTAATVGTCDRDGNADHAQGCGWMVQIRHPGNVVTVYCHMVSAPLVTVGQHVAAGAQIGWSGSSGHSSGPHLHFETHETSGSVSKANAVDPVPFMAAHGAPLGKASTT